jgi:streptogramin lyase
MASRRSPSTPRGWPVARRFTTVAIVCMAITWFVPAAHAAYGTIEFFSVPRGYPLDILPLDGEHGDLWTSMATPTPPGAIDNKSPHNHPTVENPLPAGVNAYFLAHGTTSTKIWFTEGTGAIGTLTTNGGAVTSYPITDPTFDTVGITLGPDDQMWFTEEQPSNCNPTCSYVARIGVMSAGGMMLAEYPLPGATSRAGQLTAGPDGNIWFTDPLNDVVGKITTAGAITEYPVASAGFGITTGPDGNIWFTEDKAIGQITPGGVLTEFPAPVQLGHVYDITPGADGNLWFTEWFSDGTTSIPKIGQITPSGTITEFPLAPSATQLDGITLGADGNLWFANHDGTIDRLLATVPGTPAFVLVEDNQFVPTSQFASYTPHQNNLTYGGSVKWVFLGPNLHTVTESSGMGLFDSGPVGPVSYWSYTFNAAGTYSYRDTLTGARGFIRIYPTVSPSTVKLTGTVQVTVAKNPPDPGFVFDIQIQRPGSSSFVDWQTGTTSPSTSFTPDAGTGTYVFRSRLRQVSSGAHSNWSWPVKLKVS